MSSYGAEYLNKGTPSRAEKVPLPRNQVIPEGKFQGDSSYHDNYIPGKSEKQQQFRPRGELKIGGSFEGNSSYGADYANRGIAQRAERVPLPKNHVMPEGRFEGNSNYNNDFITSKLEKQQQFRPQGELKIGGNFEGNSSYGADYANKGTAQRAERVPLPKNHVMPEGRFNGDSNYHDNFLANKPERLQQFKPEGELKIGGNFEGNSSYGADYANRGIGERAEKIPLPRNQVIPEGRFDGNSAYNNDFLSNKISPNEKFVPQGELKVGEGKFDGASSYNNDYLGRGNAIRSERVPLPKNQVLPQGRF